MEICRLCLDLLPEKTFSRLSDPYKCIINNVIPEVDLDLTIEPVICSKCSSSVEELHKFKLLCYESQQRLSQKCSIGNRSKLNVNEILHSINITTSTTKERVCRTCLEPIDCESFTVLKPSSPDAYLSSMLTMCLPEMDLEISRDPVMCENCLGSLQKLHHLKTVCLDIEDKLKNYCFKHSFKTKNSVNLHRVLESLHGLYTTSEPDFSIANVKKEKVDQILYEGSTDVCPPDTGGVTGVKDEELDLKMEEYYPFSIDEKPAQEELNKLDLIMKDVLKNHKEVVHYSCSQCSFTMANKRHYVMHLLSTHTTFNEESRLMHFCHLCDYQTIYKAQMKKHIENDHMPKEKLQCPYCSFASNYSLNLKRHIAIHEDMQSWICSFAECDFKTSYKFSLERHKIKMHGNQCSVCSFKHSNTLTIQRHLRLVHGVYKVHQCDKCDFKTFYLMTLKRHNARKHKGMMKSNLNPVKNELNVEEEEEEEIKSLLKK